MSARLIAESEVGATSGGSGGGVGGVAVQALDGITHPPASSVGNPGPFASSGGAASAPASAASSTFASTTPASTPESGSVESVVGASFAPSASRVAASSREASFAPISVASAASVAVLASPGDSGVFKSTLRGVRHTPVGPARGRVVCGAVRLGWRKGGIDVRASVPSLGRLDPSDASAGDRQERTRGDKKERRRIRADHGCTGTREDRTIETWAPSLLTNAKP